MYMNELLNLIIIYYNFWIIEEILRPECHLFTIIIINYFIENEMII